MTTRKQLNNFLNTLNSYSPKKYSHLGNWDEAFYALEEYLSTLPTNRKRVVFIDEMKFSTDTYRIKPEYERRLRERSGLFKELAKVNKTLVHTFITTYGVANAKNKSIVHSEVTMDDLFNS